MKTIFTIFTFLFFSTNFASQWIAQSTGNISTSSFKDVYAITQDVVIVSGSSGTLLKTTDGGMTWQRKNSGTTQHLGKIQFPTSDVGYVIEASGKLLKTTDAGETWSSINLENISSIYSISCINENLIFLSCKDANYNSVLLISNDGGTSWERILANDSQQNFFDIQFLTGEIGYASSNSEYYSSENNILKTVDGGKSWMQIDDSRATFNFIDSDKGFSYHSGLLKTVDGGKNFERLGQGSLYLLAKIFHINDNVIWGIFEDFTLCGCGKRGLVRVTYNSINGYKEYVQNIDAYISSIYFSNEKVGYAVGSQNGIAKIWKNTQADLTLETKEDELKNAISIYPNPATDHITISLNNTESKLTYISLTDMTGKVVYSQNVKDNANKQTIDVRKFSKGNYMLTIQNQKESHSQKIMIR